jgi:predicted DNA-binding transcriptional regulator
VSKNNIDAELKGNTLRVYVYALKKRKVGVREVQRSLNLSNPSLAQYHLNKLIELGLLRKDDSDYAIIEEVTVEIMRDFLRVGTLLVPRFLFYAVFFTIFTIYLAIVSTAFSNSSTIIFWFVGPLAIASGIFWYEAQRAWKSAPSY